MSAPLPGAPTTHTPAHYGSVVPVPPRPPVQRAVERSLVGRLLAGRLAELPEHRIRSGGYVLHTLEASFWCLLRHRTYADTVLAAVNLGDDTDTTANTELQEVAR